MSDSDIIAVDIIVDTTEGHPVEHAEEVCFLFLYYDDFKIRSCHHLSHRSAQRPEMTFLLLRITHKF